jgi:cytochrome P450
MTPETRASAEDGTVALYGFVDRLLTERQHVPAEDLVTDLLEAEARGLLDRDELRALVVNVIGGAIGSSRAAIANTILLMLGHPDQAAWVREHPHRIRLAVEECLRYQPPFRFGRRLCLERTNAFGVDLAAGETLVLARQAANRDPARWEDPDRFDVTRAERRHYSFGYGAHFCLGQALARMDTQEVVRVFLDVCPDARLLDDRPRRVPNVPDDALVSLPVALG